MDWKWIGMDWNGVLVAAEVAKTEGTLKRLVFHESLPRITFLSCCTKTDCQTQNPRTVVNRSPHSFVHLAFRIRKLKGKG